MASQQHPCLEGLEVGVWYVYVDRTIDENRLFYVGKGGKKRLQERKRNTHWKNIVAKHGWDLDHREVVLATKDEQFAFEDEKRRILELGTFENGVLGRWGANLTEGGEGVSGWKHTDECRKEFSKSRVGKLTGSKNGMYGKTGPAHHRYGTKHTITSIQKNRVSNTGVNHPGFRKPRSDEVREKIRISNAGKMIRTHLTWDDVKVIREKYENGGHSQTNLAVEYGLTKAGINKIVRYKSWKVQ